MPHRPRSRHTGSERSANLPEKMAKDIRALNSSILIISQKMRYLVRNEKILGRNLIVLNKKLRALTEGTSPLPTAEGAKRAAKETPDISPKLSELSCAVSELRAEVDEIKKKYAKAETVKEMKFLVDSINPLEFVTMKEVDERIKEARKGKKRK